MNDENAASGPEQPEDPMARWMRQFGMGGGGDFDLNKMMAHLQRAMSAMSGGGADAGAINWTQTRHAARQVVAALGTDRAVDASDQRAVAEADRLASLWLDPNVDFDALTASPAAWSRAEWVEQTMDSWRTIAEPIVTRIADALANSFGSQFGEGALPAELGQFASMMTPMLRGAAGQLYSMQLAQAIGKIAGQVVSGSELGLQLLKNPKVVLLPTNVAQFGQGLGVSDDDIRLYLTVRENARQRLFAQVGWLGPQLLALVEHYAREITIDVAALSDAVQVADMNALTPERLNELSEQLQGKLFAPSQTPEQVEIIGRLETLIALVEGWVDEVSGVTLAKWMPQSANLLDEAIRRRRATDNPGQGLFKALVGMDLRPRRVRDAANLWAALTRERGVTGRDAVWAHPDLMPTAEDLDDPLRMISPDADAPADEMDLALAELLEQAEQERRDSDESDPS